ncbi:MAG: CehA/McbA family metallohydrolase [Fibrobacterota bacterium]
MAWYKGNTHTHTMNSDGDAYPADAIRWYHDHGYHFIVLSEHNYHTHAGNLPEMADLRHDFLVVPGEELSGAKHVHFICFNSRWPVDIFTVDRTLPVDALVREYAACAAKAGGIPILNHPNWRFTATADDIAAAPEVCLLEIYNGNEDDIYNYGFTPSGNETDKKALPPVEDLWDDLLSRGKTVYGVGADDTHHYEKKGPQCCNPGRGFVMVHAPELSASALGKALLTGDFYASSGVALRESRMERGGCRLAIDIAATEENLREDCHHGNDVYPGREGFRVEFVGEGGRLVKRVEGPEGEFDPKECGSYVRGRAVYCRSHNGVRRAFYAWTQPLFL